MVTCVRCHSGALADVPLTAMAEYRKSGDLTYAASHVPTSTGKLIKTAVRFLNRPLQRDHFGATTGRRVFVANGLVCVSFRRWLRRPISSRTWRAQRRLGWSGSMASTSTPPTEPRRLTQASRRPSARPLRVGAAAATAAARPHRRRSWRGCARRERRCSTGLRRRPTRWSARRLGSWRRGSREAPRCRRWSRR